MAGPRADSFADSPAPVGASLALGIGPLLTTPFSYLRYAPWALWRYAGPALAIASGAVGGGGGGGGGSDTGQSVSTIMGWKERTAAASVARPVSMQQHTVPLHQRRPRAQHAASYCALGLGLGLGVTAAPSRSSRPRRHPARCGGFRREVRSVLAAPLECSLALAEGGEGGEGEGGEGEGGEDEGEEEGEEGFSTARWLEQQRELTETMARMYPGGNTEEAQQQMLHLSEPAVAMQLARRGKVRSALVVQGCAVWSSAQLLSEVARGSWGICHARRDDVPIPKPAAAPGECGGASLKAGAHPPTIGRRTGRNSSTTRRTTGSSFVHVGSRSSGRTGSDTTPLVDEGVAVVEEGVALWAECWRARSPIAVEGFSNPLW